MDGKKAIEIINNELKKAESKHPFWPKDKIHAVAIMIEEAGEAMQAAIDYTYTAGTEQGDEEILLNKLKKEVAQTGAMAIRILQDLPETGG